MNPLKTIIMLFMQLKIIKKKFSMIQFKVAIIWEKLMKIGLLIIEEQRTGEDVERMIEDKLYGGLQVIDVIAWENLTELLNTPIMDNIISSHWEGPYEKESILETSTTYKIIMNLFTAANDEITGVSSGAE
jgi:hypothetical protein